MFPLPQLTGLVLCCTLTLCSDTKPNFLIMLMDDMGWGDLGVHGEPSKETPTLDQMAEEGVLFPEFYSSNPLCSPSRASLLTGRLPIRNGFYTTNAHGRNAYTPQEIAGGISANEILISELLAENGYYNKIIGKWHLGHLPKYQPLEHGFHEFFGSTNCHPGPYDGVKEPNIAVFRDREMIGRYFEEFPIDKDTGESNITQMYLEDAVHFIKNSSATQQPFFLYWSVDGTHAPTYASKNFVGKSRRGRYGDAVMEMDHCINILLSTLREAGIDNNTFVFFSSDNGPALMERDKAGSNGPLLCGKQTTFEGGMRVPGIAWWPGKVASGKISHQVGTQMDLYKTMCDLAGIRLPSHVQYDSYSLVPAMITNETKDIPVFYYRGNELFAIRYGMYKMHLWTWTTPVEELNKNIDHCPGVQIVNITTTSQVNHTNTPVLFHLGRDPGERFPIHVNSVEYVSAVKSLQTQVEYHRSRLEPGKPVLNICDRSLMLWAPRGCEKINKCLPVPKKEPRLCDWPH